MPLRADYSYLPQLERMRGAGFDVVSLNAGFDLTDLASNLRMLTHFRRWVQDHPQTLVLVETVADLDEARRSHRLGVCFDLEGLASIGNQLDLLDLYYGLGVRWALLAYNKTNALGGGCQDTDSGLTPLGLEVLRRMESLGMVPCASHVGWRTAGDLLDAAAGPVIFSHSNAHAVFGHPRNIPDELIMRCAEKGGVIGVNGISRFIGEDASGNPDNGTSALFRHIDHIVQLVGPAHVGLGLDYVFDTDELLAFYRQRPDLYPPSRGYSEPTPMVEPERLAHIVEHMLAHQYSETAIAQILGGNHRRIAEQCWQPTRSEISSVFGV